jgi:uncharacterized 2Fe-2S/4Fe-4S cluster protein (DUF4445 family)
MREAMEKFQVIFQPSGVRGEVLKGKTILEASRELGAEIESLCGGMKACGKCKVQLVEGILSPFTDEETKFITEKDRAGGYRLGCAAQIEGDVLVFIPEESRAGKQVVRKAATERAIELNPGIHLYYVELSAPTLHDPEGDLDRLKEGLGESYHLSSLDIDYHALLKLSGVLRQADWKVTAAIWMEKEILDVKPGKVEDAYGLAIDIGTTTVAAYLCNFRSGELLATESIMNPQMSYGEDVMSRITYTVTHPDDGLERMHGLIVEGLNQLIRDITGRCNLSPEDILELTFVGNTVMHHFLLKIDPQYLGLSPFPPVIRQSINLKARDLGLEVHASANVYVLPVEAGFVGADNVGVLIAEEPYHQDQMVLIIDVGTNGELVMGSRKILISSSCATGPALEGAYIKFGMRAAPGAIERVKIDSKTLEVDFKVVGEELWRSESKNARVRGICGSGIIDAIAEFYSHGIIDKSGRFNPNVQSDRLRTTDGKPEFILARQEETSIGKEITITQADVRNVQLAKGALYAGAKLMMKRLGIDKVDKVVLAGAFGSYIDKEKAMILGMFPDCDLTNVYAVGNAAGDGARIALLNRKKREEAEEIAQGVEYMELTIEADFQKEFIEALEFPHMNDTFPHLKGVVRSDILEK